MKYKQHRINNIKLKAKGVASRILI